MVAFLRRSALALAIVEGRRGVGVVWVVVGVGVWEALEEAVGSRVGGSRGGGCWGGGGGVVCGDLVGIDGRDGGGAGVGGVRNEVLVGWCTSCRGISWIREM